MNPDLSSLSLYNSADDRDYCEYVHIHQDPDAATNPHGPIREVTVKSFSMSVHIRRPGFQLLSLVDPSKLANPFLKSFADAPCLLPDQYRIYTSFYAPCILFTFLILVLLNLGTSRFRGLRKNLSLAPPTTRNSSGRASPNVDSGLWGATWPPYTPALPVSPPGTLPPHIRTPHTPVGTMTMLVASQPGSPRPGSPASLVIPYSDRDEDDEEDTLYPAQYAVRRDGHKQRDDDSWSHVEQSGEEDAYEIVNDHEAGVGGNSLGRQIHHSEFITAPDHAARHVRGHRGWSYTFMYKGRPRRITFRLPTWTALHDCFDLLELSGSSSLVPRRRKDRWTSVAVDVLSVFWPAAIVWVIINWTIL